MTEYDDAIARLAVIAGQAATTRHESRIAPLVRSFAEIGARSIVLKGPVTRTRFYGDGEVRPSADIDLLVDPRFFGEATKVLKTKGYRRIDRHGHSDAFHLDDAPDVDLHLTLPYVTIHPRRTFDVLAAHVAALTVDGNVLPVLDVPAHAVHLAIHAAVNFYDPCSRAIDEWRRGHESLNVNEANTARRIASQLGVEPIWDLAEQVALGESQPGELVTALPEWEVVPRLRSLRRAAASGVPLVVRWRDVQRMIDLQLDDEAVNKWRAQRGQPPFVGSTLQFHIEKLRRFVDVSGSGVRRFVSNKSG